MQEKPQKEEELQKLDSPESKESGPSVLWVLLNGKSGIVGTKVDLSSGDWMIDA